EWRCAHSDTLPTDNCGNSLSPARLSCLAAVLSLARVRPRAEVSGSQSLFALLGDQARREAALGEGCRARHCLTGRAEALPRRIHVAIAENVPKKRSGWPWGAPRTASSRMTIVPRRIVAIGQPVVVMPSN